MDVGAGLPAAPRSGVAKAIAGALPIEEQEQETHNASGLTGDTLFADDLRTTLRTSGMREIAIQDNLDNTDNLAPTIYLSQNWTIFTTNVLPQRPR
jgi:hypothetical protein